MNKIFFLCILCSLFLILPACREQTVSPEDNAFFDCQYGFVESLGSSIVETPEGYYMFLGNYLVFMDNNMKNPAIVCSKPECLHNNEPIETAINCDAIFPGTSHCINYYNGYLYISAEAFTPEYSMCIYKVALDGSSRKSIYNSQVDLVSFVVHRGKGYVYTKEYDTESTTPTLIVTEISLDKPSQKKIIFESNALKDPEINYMLAYDKYLYIDMIEFSGYLTHNPRKINLDTGEISDVFNFHTEGFHIGNNQLYTTVAEGEYSLDVSQKITFYQCAIDEKQTRQLTEQDFSVVNQLVYLSQVDDNYVYFKDIDIGNYILPESERKLHIYKQDGTLAGEVAAGDFAPGYVILSGKEKLFIKSQNDATEITYYCVDKSDLKGGTVVAREILRVTPEYYKPIVY